MDDKQLTLLRRHKIGFIFQSFNLLPMFTAEQNILMPLTLAGDKPDHAWFDLLVDTLGLKQRLNHRRKKVLPRRTRSKKNPSPPYCVFCRNIHPPAFPIHPKVFFMA